MHDSVTCLVEEHLPLLLRAAGEISADFARLESVPHVTRASTH
jgi:IclR family pca regulon transcriptional regulator